MLGIMAKLQATNGRFFISIPKSMRNGSAGRRAPDRLQ